MIIVPEIKTVFILVPRTGSGSLYRALLKRYPDSIMLYRHMEADGVPLGYDRWRKIGVVRNPIDRLWSLYNFIQSNIFINGLHDKGYIEEQLKSIRHHCDFNNWVLHNESVFTNPYSTSDGMIFYPRYAVIHSLPETRKSQFLYLRPDLGTEIYSYSNLHSLYQHFDLEPNYSNVTNSSLIVRPIPSRSVEEHIEKYFAWDLYNS